VEINVNISSGWAVTMLGDFDYFAFAVAFGWVAIFWVNEDDDIRIVSYCSGLAKETGIVQLAESDDGNRKLLGHVFEGPAHARNFTFTGFWAPGS
jgi:hypothetical protein